MRKKDILGNYVKQPDVKYSHAIRKLDGEIEAYSALIRFLPGCREFYSHASGEPVRLAGDGCRWLMYLPLDEYWCLNTYYSPEGEILGWYFDLSKGNFLDENGMPCTDDIFLDLIILPNGQPVTDDADELQEALDNGVITADDFKHAYAVHDQILASKWNDVALLTELSATLLAEYE
jgi:predicted RNA-binding protein associated with RNAse of E/G family